MPELYVIGTQETSSNKKEWEILIQQTIGPSHILLQSASLGSLHLVLFIHRDLLWYCSGVKSANFATRPLSQFKTKGAVGLMFNLFGTSFLFITSHLSAHQQRVEERNSDYKRISSYFALPDTPAKNKAEVMEYDYVFWFGDLNYRVELSREECNELLTRSNILELLLNDQLTREILAGNTFYHFSEQPITFNPSYKFDLDSDVYDTSQKRRTPSWTDRILFQSRDSRSASVTGHGYHCCENIRISDHRPVYAYFKASLKPCNDVDGIHDIVTSFNADIYNKANRRRKVTAEQSQELRKTITSNSTRTPSSSTSSTGHRQVSSAYCILL
ncbi:phosphatidylinositol polyphosphate 5-phosphatase type IV-like isoform X2 [Dysidea avara]